jgi:hypothetical protein
MASPPSRSMPSFTVQLLLFMFLACTLFPSPTTTVAASSSMRRHHGPRHIITSLSKKQNHDEFPLGLCQGREVATITQSVKKACIVSNEIFPTNRCQDASAEKRTAAAFTIVLMSLRRLLSKKPRKKKHKLHLQPSCLFHHQCGLPLPLILLPKLLRIVL